MRLLWLSLAAPALTTDCSTAPCGARALLDAGDARFPLSASFDLTADLAARCSAAPAGSRGRDRRERNPELRARHERAENRSGLEERLELQMRRYRAEPVFGLLENKLLVKRALAALGIPHVAPIYAALAHDRHPERWARAPRYSRRALERAVSAWPGWASRALVLKAATDGQGKSVHVLDRERLQRLFAEAEPKPKSRLAKLPPLWIREHAKKHAAAAANASASLALVARTAEALLAKPADWGQRFEHRGVLLEARYDYLGLVDPRERDRAGSTTTVARPQRRGVVEFKFAVALGVAHTALGFGLGGADDGERARWVLRRETPARRGAPFLCEDARDRACAERAARVLNAADALARIDVWSDAVAGFFGADWLRLDVMTGNNALGWRVNEVTYPGHLPAVQPAWRELRDVYCSEAARGRGADARRWRVLRADDVLRRIAADAGVPYEFLASAPEYSDAVIAP